MSVRAVIRDADWMIGVDRTPGASGPVYEVECTTCGETSDAAEDRTSPEDWALRHAGRNPSHRSYRAITHRSSGSSQHRGTRCTTKRSEAVRCCGPWFRTACVRGRGARPSRSCPPRASCW
ncbi:DUF7848 domain-containing protein [Streptomyces sp. 372A]